jgi:hypothetical protein
MNIIRKWVRNLSLSHSLSLSLSLFIFLSIFLALLFLFISPVLSLGAALTPFSLSLLSIRVEKQF